MDGNHKKDYTNPNPQSLRTDGRFRIASVSSKVALEVIPIESIKICGHVLASIKRLYSNATSQLDSDSLHVHVDGVPRMNISR